MHHLDVCVEKPVQAVGQALFLRSVQGIGHDGFIVVALLEAHVGEVVNGHLHFGFGVFRFDELQDFLSRLFVETLQGSL